jgi:serine-type D-Ala-D-Ala carboxypeptidase (penicillin-binding protein 5/6)
MVLRLALAAPLALAGAPALAEDPFPGAAAAYLVLVDGAPLWERAADAPRQPASLAKLMSALVVVDEGRLDEEVRVSRAASRARGARLGLRAGERLVARELLAGMLVGSANDACLALATRDGTVADFVARMNARAPLIGLRDTHFGDPCGFDRDGQHTTARDLARLATVALRRPQIAALVRRPEIDLATVGADRVLRVRNTNVLLESFPEVIGVKTGQTRRAGENLIALAERDGRRVLLVLLGARDRWWDAHAILARALER